MDFGSDNAAGVHPAIAAAAIYAGTYGAIFNPGYAQVALVAEVAKVSNMEVVSAMVAKISLTRS